MSRLTDWQAGWRALKLRCECTIMWRCMCRFRVVALRINSKRRSSARSSREKIAFGKYPKKCTLRYCWRWRNWKNGRSRAFVLAETQSSLQHTKGVEETVPSRVGRRYSFSLHYLFNLSIYHDYYASVQALIFSKVLAEAWATCQKKYQTYKLFVWLSAVHFEGI